MKRLLFLFLVLFVASCGGGGGRVVRDYTIPPQVDVYDGATLQIMPRTATVERGVPFQFTYQILAKDGHTVLSLPDMASVKWATTAGAATIIETGILTIPVNEWGTNHYDIVVTVSCEIRWNDHVLTNNVSVSSPAVPETRFLTTIMIVPNYFQMAPGDIKQFSAYGVDQNFAVLDGVDFVSWKVVSGEGSVSELGTFHAGSEGYAEISVRGVQLSTGISVEGTAWIRVLDP